MHADQFLNLCAVNYGRLSWWAANKFDLGKENIFTAHVTGL